jgi:hypothetical protein
MARATIPEKRLSISNEYRKTMKVIAAGTKKKRA